MVVTNFSCQGDDILFDLLAGPGQPDIGGVNAQGAA